MFDYTVLCAFAGYLAIMLGIGFLFSRRQENLGDYYLGGRRMNKWVVALSAQASDMSGWLLMGLPGAIYVGGFSEAWIGIGLLIGTYLNWKIVAHRLRRYSQASIDTPAEVKGSRRIAMSWVTISLAAAVVIGLVFHLYLGQRGLTLADAARAASPDSIFHLYELAPGFLFAFVVTVVVSLLTARPPKEVTEEFDAVAESARD